MNSSSCAVAAVVVVVSGQAVFAQIPDNHSQLLGECRPLIVLW